MTAAASQASATRLDEAARRLLPAEEALFRARRPQAAALAAGGGGFHQAVPMHWMRDWPTPFPMVIERAQGARLVDIDGNRLVDVCLGDGGALFGHGPEPVLQALRDRAEGGLTHMLPSADAEAVGRGLAARFGLPRWQVAATASDANRFALRVARAVTGRRRILVFDGCYHGAVDDTLVDLADGDTAARRSLIGQAADPAATTLAVPFNDPDALAAALAGGDIACVLTEPALTNCSMVLPAPGFHRQLRALTRAHGTLLVLDETHTIATGPGGYGGRFGLEPDMLVVGKPIAGGVPAAVWGFTEAVAERLSAVRAVTPPGHSGIGTTLAGSALQVACIRACLEQVMTEAAYARMAKTADAIEAGLAAVIARHGLPWHIARLGARMEIVFAPEALENATAARAAAQPAVERLIHLAMLNRGFLLTPFHAMLLICPALDDVDAAALTAAFEAVVATLSGAARD